MYRFAFFMTGEGATATAVLRRTIERAVRAGIGDLRDARRVKRRLFTEARHQCAQPAAVTPDALATDPSVPPETEAGNAGAPPPLAARFSSVPTAERSALVLFYLYLFDPAELAEVLEIPPAELAPLLTRGRTLLGPSV